MPFQDANEALKHHSEESFSRLVVSMEEKFEESLKAEKEQMELAFKLKAKDHDLYDRLANSPITTRANSRRASLAKISSMSDLLALKAPTLESLEAMGPEELKQKFIVLMDHFYAAVDEIRALRARLSKAQDTIGKSNSRFLTPSDRANQGILIRASNLRLGLKLDINKKAKIFALFK